MLLDQRAVRYIPHGAKVGVLPHLKITTTSVADGGTLSMSVSEIIYGTLPDVFEVGVEVWNGTAWVEGPDARFLVNKSSTDRASVTGVKQLGGIAIVLWLLNKNNLAGVAPLEVSGITVESSRVLENVTGSGIEIYKSGHGLEVGRRVKVWANGNATDLAQNSMQFVREPLTADRFRLVGAIDSNNARNVGPAASGITLALYKERLLASNHGFVRNEKVRFSVVGASALKDDVAYFVRHVSANWFTVSKEVGGLSVTLDEDSGLVAYRDLDGDRLFKNATVGQILRTVIQEGKARGWGSSVAMDFTGATDSLGNAWAATVATGDGLPIGFKPGTTARQVLNALADAGYIEFATQGRTLRVFNAGSGRQLGLGNQPVRVGDDALSSPTATDLDNLLTHLTVRGDGPIQKEVAATDPVTILGRLEQFQTQAGITTNDVAADIGKARLQLAQSPEQEFTVTENANDARFLPFLHYVRGDWVRINVNGEARQMRVAGISCASGEDGTQVSVTLGVVMRDLLVKLAQGQGRLSGGIGTGGAGQVRPTPSTRRPAAPLGLLVQSQALFNLDGSAQAMLTVTFRPVLHDGDGYLLNVPSYQVWARGDGDEEPVLLGSPTVGATTVGPVAAARTYFVSVRGRSEWGEWGEYSSEFEIYAAPPVDPPYMPTPPVVTSSLGVLHANWDGRTAAPGTGAVVPAPPGFAYWFCEVSDGEDGPFVPIGQTLLAVGEVVAAGLTIGENYWVRAYTVNRLGISSAPTAAVSAVLEGITMPDLDTGIQDAINDAVNGAADAQEAAAEAVASANGKNRMFHAVVDPNEDGTADGDVWHKWTNLGTSGKLLATWRWDEVSTAWAPTVLDSTYIPLLDIGAGTFGNLDGQRLAVNTVTANKLLVGDFTNLLDDPSFIGTFPSGAWRDTSTESTGSVVVATGRPFNRWLRVTVGAGGLSGPATSYNGNVIPCQAGDQFYVSVGRVHTSASSGGSGYALRWKLVDGTYAYSTNRTSTANGIVTSTYTAPANTVSVEFGISVLTGFLPLNNCYFYQPVLRRVNGGELIVDGAVLARHMQADEIWANAAWVDQAQINTLTAGVIVSAMIDANAINGKTITGANVRTAASGARVQLDTTGLRAFNAAGAVVSSILTSTGQLSAVGSLSTGTTGQRVEISSTTAKFYNPGGYVSTIAGYANGASGSGLLLSAGGSALILGSTAMGVGGTADLFLNGSAFFQDLYNGGGSLVPRFAKGTGSLSVAANSGASATITLPAGVFTSAPNVMVSFGPNAQYFGGSTVSVWSVSATSLVVGVSNTTAGTKTHPFTWVAIQ